VSEPPGVGSVVHQDLVAICDEPDRIRLRSAILADRCQPADHRLLEPGLHPAPEV